MKNLFKHSMVAVATMALAGSVYAIPTLVVTDGSGISAINTSASGVVTITTGDTLWSVVVATGISSPPAVGQGSAANPTMDLQIFASYVGGGGTGAGTGNPLTISFGSDNFGPTDGSVIATLTAHVVSGTGNAIGFTTLAASGSVLPTTGTPTIPGTTLTSASVALGSGPGGTYFSSLTGGPLNLASYTLDEVITLTGNSGGSTYSIDASLVTVPDGGMTLVLLGSALSGLALIKRKLA